VRQETCSPPDGVIEKSRQAEKDVGPYPRRVPVHIGEDEIHVSRAQKKTDWKCPSESVAHEQLRLIIDLFHSDLFSPETGASSLPIPTFDLISLTK